jgi:hypothetical protein
MKGLDLNSRVALPLLAGTISEGVAREFLSFTRIYQDLPSIEKIISSGDVIAVPREPSILFALTGAIAAHHKDTNAEALMKFITRIPKEFQVVCLREVIQRNRDAIGFPSIAEWIRFNGQELF